MPALEDDNDDGTAGDGNNMLLHSFDLISVNLFLQTSSFMM